MPELTSPTGPRIFDLGQANRLVPMLRETFTQVRAWIAEIQEATERLERAAELGATERAALADERQALLGRVEAALRTLTELGIEVKAAEGLVDFRAMREGRQVYLCWRYPEDVIAFWHELEAGYAGRRPVHSPAEFERAYLS